MAPLKPFVVFVWIALPTVMFGGFSLLRFLTAGGLTPFKEQFFRAGHAHAGVLLILSLAYLHFLGQTEAEPGYKQLAAFVLMAGVLFQSGGFFLHMALGEPGKADRKSVV